MFAASSLKRGLNGTVKINLSFSNQIVFNISIKMMGLERKVLFRGGREGEIG